MRTTAALVLALVAVQAPASAQDHAHVPQHEVGRVTFPTSCAPAVQPQFEQAVAMLHSFWFEAAHGAFEKVANEDPACAMAHWGVAMTLLGNPMARVAPRAENLEKAQEAVARAVALGANVTERERAYIDAVAALYRDPANLDHFARMRLHEEAMKRVYEQHPEDAEAAIFYARAMVANAPPEDLTFQRQLEAARMLEPLFTQQPDHPGLAHYIIHAFDAPAIAEHGLEAAKRYAAIAPAAPHALHMPSHIFTRLGYWDESIETNSRSAQAEPNPDAAVHPMDYMVYAYLQQGRDAEAQLIVARAVDLPNQYYAGILGYNFTAMPARLALERGRWADATQLPTPTGAMPAVSAITHFARGIGAARSGKADMAAEEAAQLSALRDTLDARKDSYWRTIVEAQRLAVEAWVAHARGDNDAAARLAQQAAEVEETVEKHPVTPGPLLPARELQADLLLELGRPAEARVAYEKTLEREPRRARALYGAARAAELAGERETAQKYYEQVLDLMDRADADRAEARAARAFLEKRKSSSDPVE